MISVGLISQTTTSLHARFSRKWVDWSKKYPGNNAIVRVEKGFSVHS